MQELKWELISSWDILFTHFTYRFLLSQLKKEKKVSFLLFTENLTELNLSFWKKNVK